MTTDQTILRRYHAALERCDQLGGGESFDPNLTGYQQRAEYRLGRMEQMVTALGDPLAATPIVHVAGTSGKGSTATAIASILIAAGYRTGLHTSPYLQTATEKLQIDHELIAGDAFATLVDTTLDRLEGAGFQPSYGQLWVAMVLGWFEQEAVDVAVIEVGAGGRFDLTNVVHSMVSVITEIGYDHMDALGSTIEQIAWHKAGIIEPATPVVTAATDESARRVIEGIASDLGADLYRVTPTARNFQRTNEATARLAVDLLEFDIDVDDVAVGLAHDQIPGRAEIVQRDPLVILDGAHNPQKIAALASWYQQSYPGTQPIIVAGFLDSKDLHGMLQLLAEIGSALILTEPRIDNKPAASAGKLADIARDLGITAPLHTEPDPQAAVAIGLDLARRTNAPLLVTGSLYLIGNVRGRWYPDDAVLLQRTPWPRGRSPEPWVLRTSET